MLPNGMLFQLVTAVAFLALAVFLILSAVVRQFPTALVPASVLLLRLFRIEWLLQAARMFLHLVAPASVLYSKQCL